MTDAYTKDHFFQFSNMTYNSNSLPRIDAEKGFNIHEAVLKANARTKKWIAYSVVAGSVIVLTLAGIMVGLYLSGNLKKDPSQLPVLTEHAAAGRGDALTGGSMAGGAGKKSLDGRLNALGGSVPTTPKPAPGIDPALVIAASGTDLVDNINDAIGDTVDNVQDVVSDAAEAATDVVGDMMDTASDVAENLADAASNVVEGLTENIAEAVEDMTERHESLTEAAQDTVEDVLENMEDRMETALDLLQNPGEVAEDLLDNVRDSFDDFFDDNIDDFDDLETDSDNEDDDDEDDFDDDNNDRDGDDDDDDDDSDDDNNDDNDNENADDGNDNDDDDDDDDDDQDDNETDDLDDQDDNDNDTSDTDYDDDDLRDFFGDFMDEFDAFDVAEGFHDELDDVLEKLQDDNEHRNLADFEIPESDMDFPSFDSLGSFTDVDLPDETRSLTKDFDLPELQFNDSDDHIFNVELPEMSLREAFSRSTDYLDDSLNTDSSELSFNFNNPSDNFGSFVSDFSPSFATRPAPDFSIPNYTFGSIFQNSDSSYNSWTGNYGNSDSNDRNSQDSSNDDSQSDADDK